MAGTPSDAATRSAARAPNRPPSVPAPAICPNLFFAERGSKRSLAISQNPDASNGPAPETCRYRMTAVADGDSDLASHSPRNSTPLATNEAGTSLDGAILPASRACTATRRIDDTDVAMSIVGSAVKAKEVRKSASRVAFPPTNCAVTAAAQSMAISIGREVRVMSGSRSLSVGRGPIALFASTC